jgi:hypothetical protein
MHKLARLAPRVPASDGACFGPPSCDWYRSNVCRPAAPTTNTAPATRKITWATPIIGLAADRCSRSIRHSTAQARTHALGSSRPIGFSAAAFIRSGVGGAGGAFGTTRNAVHGRAVRTSCGSMPATVPSATAALASAAALLEPTWAGSVGGAELHRSHRTQPAALLCYSRYMLLTHGCTLQRALCTFSERRISRSSKALLALQEHAGKRTQARPARGAARANIGTVGSRPRVRFAPVQRTVPPLVGAPGLARRRRCCDKRSTINIRMCHDRSRHSRALARYTYRRRR